MAELRKPNLIKRDPLWDIDRLRKSLKGVLDAVKNIWKGMASRKKTK